MQKALLGLVSGIATAACVAPDDGGGDSVSDHEAYILDDVGCVLITCGRNIGEIGNKFVDTIVFDDRPNAVGQRFVSWKTATGVPIEPVLKDTGLAGSFLGGEIPQKLLAGSTFTLGDPRYGGQIYLRIDEVAERTLHGGRRVWTYRMSKLAPSDRRPVWTPLCSLFEHTSSVEARFAIIGTREMINSSTKTVTPLTVDDRTITIGCPNTATGKLLALGMLTTTAPADPDKVPWPEDMTAALRALTLSPTGGKSYTGSGKNLTITVKRTGMSNMADDFAGRPEGLWKETGAICFYDVRVNGDQIWNDTHIPPCESADRSSSLVSTHLGQVDDATHPPYPPPLPGDWTW